MFDVGNKRCVVFLRNTKFNHNFPPEIGVCVVITHAYIIHSVGSVVNENQVYRMITNLVTGCKNNQNPTKLSVAADVLLTFPKVGNGNVEKSVMVLLLSLVLSKHPTASPKYNMHYICTTSLTLFADDL